VDISSLENPESIEQIINKLLSVRASLNSFFLHPDETDIQRRFKPSYAKLMLTVGCAFYSFSNDALNDEMFLDKCT